MKNNQKNDKENLLYIGLIIVTVLILSIRVFSQGQQMGETIENIRQEGLEFDTQSKSLDENEEEDISFDQKFRSSDEKISFNYPSDWQEVENENILKLLQNPNQQEDLQGEQEVLDQLENIEGSDITNNTQEVSEMGDTVFMAMKSTFPNLAVGIISVQNLNKKVTNTEEIEELLIEELEYNHEENETSIVRKEREEDYALIETVTSAGGRAVFRSKNIGYIIEEEAYIFNFNSPYDTWGDFENEFNMIISSIEIND